MVKKQVLILNYIVQIILDHDQKKQNKEAKHSTIFLIFFKYKFLHWKMIYPNGMCQTKLAIVSLMSTAYFEVNLTNFNLEST